MNLASIREKLTLAECQTGAAESDTLEEGLGQLINWVIDNIATPPVGSVVAAAVSEAQFTATKPAGSWVLCDGRSVAGSAFQTRFGIAVAPDLRGATPRGQNAGRVDGKQNPSASAVGAYQVDDFNTHGHSPVITSDAAYSNGTNDKAQYNPPPFGTDHGKDYSSAYAIAGDLTITLTGLTGTSSDSSESRVVSTTVNFFLRVN